MSGCESPETVVFMVDDEPLLLELARAILKPHLSEIRTFQSPLEALESFQAAQPRPALVITDYSMPEMNGMDFIRAIRRIHPGQPVILTSGTAREEVYRDSEEKPDAFLAKPYFKDHLAKVVTQTLQKRV